MSISGESGRLIARDPTHIQKRRSPAFNASLASGCLDLTTFEGNDFLIDLQRLHKGQIPPQMEQITFLILPGDDGQVAYSAETMAFLESALKIRDIQISGFR